MVFRVHVKANAKSDFMFVKENNELDVRISAVPVDGKANKYLIGYLSKIFKVSRSSVIILKGLNNPYKTVEIIADDTHIKNILNDHFKV
jgi:uncharacterized protein (TIGR00251 family)